MPRGRKRSSPPRQRGYRIRSQVEGQDWMQTQSETIWAIDPQLPQEWEATKRDPGVVKALLIRSGKKFASYQR